VAIEVIAAGGEPCGVRRGGVLRLAAKAGAEAGGFCCGSGREEADGLGTRAPAGAGRAAVDARRRNGVVKAAFCATGACGFLRSKCGQAGESGLVAVGEGGAELAANDDRISHLAEGAERESVFDLICD